MAAPAEKTLKDLNGKWTMNHALSDSAEPGLILQGISYLVRKGILMATISLDVTQYEGPPNPPSESTDIVTHIDIVQSAGSLSSTQENRCADDVYREHSDWLFGNVRGKTKWIALEEGEDEYLKGGWEPEADGKYIRTYVENDDYGWTADQIWGFQIIEGERYYCRNILIKKGDERAEFRLVYDWTPAPEADAEVEDPAL